MQGVVHSSALALCTFSHMHLRIYCTYAGGGGGGGEHLSNLRRVLLFFWPTIDTQAATDTYAPCTIKEVMRVVAVEEDGCNLGGRGGGKGQRGQSNQ